MVLMVLLFSACGEHEISSFLEEQKPEPQPTPVVVSNVSFDHCQFQNINWVAENAQFNVLKSRSQELEAFVAATTTKNVVANIEYSDGSVVTESKQYSETNKFGFYGLSEYREISDMSIFDAQPQKIEVEENLVNAQGFLFNFNGVKIYSIVSSQKSSNEVTFHGRAISTCTNEWTLEFQGASYYAHGASYEKEGKIYTPYNITLSFKASVDGGGAEKEGTIILNVKNVLHVKDAPVKEPEPEFMGYVWEDENITWNGDKLVTSGTLREIWSDGSKRNPVHKSCELNWSVASPADQVKYVDNLFWNTKNVSQNNYLDGSSSRDGYTIKNYSSKVTLTANYFSCEFSGTYEKASFVAPNGETIEMLAPELLFDGTVAQEGAEGKDGDYQTLDVKVSTTANIYGKSKSLASNVRLMVYVAPTPDPDPVQTGMYVENERVDGDYIVFDIVKVFDTKPEERSTEKFLHGCGMEVENALTTQARQYGVLNTNPSKKSETSFTALGGKVNGVTEAWENVFYYQDFNNTITYYYPAKLTYSENGFTDAININTAVVNKTGSETATAPSKETENSKTYNDKIYYSMLFGGEEVDNGVQTVVFTETVEPTPEPEPTPVTPTYEGYHVVASRSGAAYVFDKDWYVYIAHHIEFENDNNPNDRFTVLKVYGQGTKKGTNYETKIIGSSNGQGYPAATYTENGGWTIGHIQKAENGAWKQISDSKNGYNVTVSSVNALYNNSKVEIKTFEISRGNWNSTTKTYTLEGVEYR